MGGDLAQDRDVVAAEVVRVPAEEVERADRLRLVQQRHDDLRRHARHELHVARIGREVVDHERLVARDRGADEPVTELEAKRLVARRIPDGVRGLQLAAPLVEEVDRERLERDQPADEDRDLREEIVEIEDRGDLAAQVEQRPDDLVLDGGRRGQLVCCRGRGIVFFGWGISVTHWVKIALGCSFVAVGRQFEHRFSSK